jgi:hypothetical protein
MRSTRFPFFSCALAAAAFAAALLPATPAGAQCGDVNGNDEVTTSDALSVLRVAVGQPVDLVCEGECTEIEPRVDTLEAQLAEAMETIAALQDVLAGVTRTEDAIVISGANLQVVDGSGSTTGPTNGLGNVIIGYNEADPDREQTGSHNLVVGMQHEFTSYGGIVGGEDNTILAPGASVFGGKGNIASEDFAAVGGGSLNVAEGELSTVSGGFKNGASALNSSVSGGCENQATNFYSSVSGGFKNTASGQFSSVSGGSTRSATALYDWTAGTLTETE